MSNYGGLSSDETYETAHRMRIRYNPIYSQKGPNIVLKELLEPPATTQDTHETLKRTKPPVAFAFSGQGTFYQGMGRDLYGVHPFFTTRIQELDAICLNYGFPSILPAITADMTSNHTFAPIVTQLALVCIKITLCWLWQELGIQPSVVVGCSLGEFAAIYAAGILSASDTIFLVGTRALLMQKLCTPHTHGVLAVGADWEDIQDMTPENNCELACVNTPKGICVAGPVSGIDKIQVTLKAESQYKCHRLNLPYAFHSAQLDPILEEYESIARRVTFNSPKVPYISSLLGEVVTDRKTINASYLAHASRQPVQLVKALESAYKGNIITEKTIWVDVGPHPMCGNFVKTTMSQTALVTNTLHRDQNNWCTLADSMAALYNTGLDINWDAWNRSFETNIQSFPDRNQPSIMAERKMFLQSQQIPLQRTASISSSSSSSTLSSTPDPPSPGSSIAQEEPSIDCAMPLKSSENSVSVCDLTDENQL